MKEIWIFLGLLGLLIFLLVRRRFDEHRELKGRTRDALSMRMRAEIEQEKSQSIERKKNFEEALQSAGGSTPGGRGGDRNEVENP